MKRWSVFGMFLLLVLFTKGQRSYVANSVLSSGSWVKISTTGSGIYRINADQLKSVGISGTISSTKIHLFGSAGGELPEDNAALVSDDLSEVSIEMIDGGDGIFDGTDHILFYSSGPDSWVYDSISKRFQFKKNHYSNRAYFFLQLSDVQAVRLTTAPNFSNPIRQVDRFYERYRYELDSINFLKSGKEWYGEDFSNQPGRKSSREFIIPFTTIAGSEMTVISDLVGRGFGQVNRIPVSVNGKTLLEHQTSPLVGTNLEPTANPSRQEGRLIPTTGSISLTYQFNGSGVNAEAWLNWFEVHATRSLDMQGLPFLIFRDTSRSLSGGAVEYRISNPAVATQVWDITFPLKPRKINVQAGSPLRFVQDLPHFKEYIAFDAGQVRSATMEGLIPNQNLHGVTAQDMVIVTDKSLIDQANRLAAFHRQNQGLKVLVVDPESIYHEYSSGIPDPTAIRNFMKMLYDRAAGDVTRRPKYLLLFGGASYVQLESGSMKKNRVPAYQSSSSLDPLTSYVTDDYFGFLDDTDDINRNAPAPMLDIGIGRIPARTPAQAKVAVDKILNYHAPLTFGSWRNSLTLVADDEDFNLHLNDAELHASLISSGSAAWNIKKIYLDAFQQEGGTSGSFYPTVNASISKNINKGTLIWNYSGHGGSSRLAQESILDKNMVATWENGNRLPIFITATCDFAPFDDPTQSSIGEELLMARPSGSIALMTTTRLVFASSNRIINNNFLNALLTKDAAGKVPTLGRALLLAKNFTVQNSGDYINARKFIMLGDPAIKPGIPEYGIRTTAINGKLTGVLPDTIRANGEYEIEGEVLKPDGSIAQDFNGDVFPQVFDKPMPIKTLANDPQSNAVNFLSSEIIVYSGKVQAQNGKFSFKFITPKDINLTYGKARISYYAHNASYDAAGGMENIIVGGIANTVVSDLNGPLIKGYLDSVAFKNGGIVGPTPLLFLDIADVSGINLTGSLGHEIILSIDGDPSKTIVLNDLFIPVIGNQSGTIQLRLPPLEEGAHKLTIRAWDVFNNSSTLVIDCNVVVPRSVNILSLQSIPNPLKSAAVFRAALTGPTLGAIYQLSLFTLGGQVVRTFRGTINEPSMRSIDIVWDGRDERGNALGSGIYVFALWIKTKEGIWTQKPGRLVVL